ncbi:MAG: radical SAM protein [Clostridia bacterium]|nr:radical SAM protein [Clostridia bacterium]
MKFSMLYADARGQLYDHPHYALVGRTGDRFTEPLPEEMIPLPEGASLTLVPGGIPLGVDRKGDFRLVREAATVIKASARNSGRNQGPVFAVGALLPQGYTRTLLPAYRREAGEKPLPLLGYAAVGMYREKFYVAAVETDQPAKWNPCGYNTADLSELVADKVNKYPGNRILAQLARCSLDYGCLTAQNIFYGRWEGGIPVSPVCNANCLGCISLQPAECCPSPQERINFTPTVEEIIQVGLPHLEEAPEGIISFGQGCEGEPSLAVRVVAPAVSTLRSQTSKGTININTNAGLRPAIREICQAGLDAMRVSVIGPSEEVYNSYYRPRDYNLNNVAESIKIAKAHGVYVSLNLLTLPGLTDREGEIEALIQLVQATVVDLIQFRNLNIDPDQFLPLLPPRDDEILGITELIRILKRELPNTALGSFSRPVRPD